MDHVEVLREKWDEAYRAFKGAFDTPLAKMRDDSDYANDARARLEGINELILGLSAKTEGEAVAWESFLSSLRSGERQAVIDSASRGESLTRKAFEAGVTAYPPRSHGVVVDEAMIDAYLSAQAKAVQAVDGKWGGGGKAASYLHPVRESCRAGLQAALVAALGEGE